MDEHDRGKFGCQKIVGFVLIKAFHKKPKVGVPDL